VTCRPLPVRLSRAVWGVVLRTHRRQATLVCLIALGLVTTVVVAGPAAGEPPQIAAKRAEAQRVLDEIQSLDSQLERAVEAYNGATEDLTRIEAERALNTRHLSIAKNNLVVAQRRLGDRIRAMYKQPQDDSTLAILLGAHSLTEFLDSVETVNSVASQDTQVVGEIKKFKHDVTVRAAFLKKAQARQEQVVSQRAAAKQEIESGLAERQRLVESIKGEISRLEAEEQARQARLAAAAQQRLQAELSAQKEAAAQAQQSGTDVVGASAITPEGVSVAPPARFGGAVGVAMQYLGTPYVWGGSSPGGFDCSGFVMYVYAQVGVYLPHHAADQYNYGTPVSRDELAPGDLVFFDGLGHVGIYIGGGEFVHAPHTGDVVKISSLNDSWYSSTYVGARRL
jgi:cell wall-associated NlpC family hydrolase